MGQERTLISGGVNYHRAIIVERADGQTIGTVNSVTAEIEDCEGNLISGSGITLSPENPPQTEGTIQYGGSFPETLDLTVGETVRIMTYVVVDGILTPQCAEAKVVCG